MSVMSQEIYIHETQSSQKKAHSRFYYPVPVDEKPGVQKSQGLAPWLSCIQLLSTSWYLAHVINIITWLIRQIRTSDIRQSRVVHTHCSAHGSNAHAYFEKELLNVMQIPEWWFCSTKALPASCARSADWSGLISRNHTPRREGPCL